MANTTALARCTSEVEAKSARVRVMQLCKKKGIADYDVSDVVRPRKRRIELSPPYYTFRVYLKGPARTDEISEVLGELRDKGYIVSFEIVSQ